MKTIKKEKLQEFLDQIESEDPYCGLYNEDKALSDLIKYLENNDIEVQ